ncbi:phage tail tape measure protein [Oceanobacillus salinisoli]|uniref:phage tail tape measure protein n=1 Tax=Oceanobacillus salinisoli TaxID=2678611 RepID=UPI0012E1C9E1|nr:phage tail tape measure protein [Oceanobacillus salinisoli]
MAEIGALRTRISLDSAQFQQSMEGVNRQLKSLKQEQKAVTSSGTGFARGVDELRAKSDVLNRTLELQQAKVAELKRRYDESRKATNENSKETQEAQIAYNKAVSEMNKTENALKGITEEIERQTNPWLVLSRNMDDAGRKMQTVGNQMSTVGRGLTTRVTLPIVGLGAAALSAGMNFEEGMSQVQAISGATGSDLEDLEEQAKEMGSTTRFSATEAADGMSYLAMAGFEVNEILDTMPGLLDLAASSNMDLGRAADIASNIISGFGMEAAEAGRVADVLAAGASSANTTVEQLGGAMSVVAPVASALGLEIEGVSAAVGFMSDAGIQGEQSGRMLRQGFLRLADPTGEAADLIDELGIKVFDADGNMKDLDAVVGELEDGLGGMSSEARTAALSTLFGAESVAGWTALIDRGSDELASYTKELQDSEGAASDMADTMEDNAKGSIREFQSALEGAGIALSEHLLPAVTDAVEWGTELVRKFGELDEGAQKNIVTMAGLAAAAGPVIMVAGNLTTSIGGLLRVGSSLTGMLGKAGGAGLLGRIGLMGASGGPVGLAAAGVAGLTYWIYTATKDTENLHDVNYDLINSVNEEITAMDDLTARFEELHRKNTLTSDEMLRYMDIMDELKEANSVETIAALTEEQERLLEKSGLTNEEMDEFLGLNDTIVENTPNVTSAISDQGNAYIDNLNILKDLNAEKREELLMDAQRELEKALENENQLLKDQKNLESDIKDIRDQINDTQDERLDKMRELEIEEIKQKEISEEIEALKRDMEGLDGEALTKAESKLALLELEKAEQDSIVEAIGYEKDELDDVYDKLRDKLTTKREDLEETEKEIEKTQKLRDDYEQLILKQANITAEKGEGLAKIDEELRKIDEAKDKLGEQLRNQEINTAEYQEQNRELDRQRDKLLDAQRELEEINTLAGETVFDKEVRLSTEPSLNRFNTDIGSPISKLVQLRAGSLAVNSYASGTDYHPGGPALVGEEGPELAKMGSRWSLLDFGVANLPTGTQVFTNDETNKILSAMNRLPAYADGISPSGEVDRIISSMNNPAQLQGEAVIYTTVINQMDGREISRHTYEHVTEFQERDKEVRDSFA